MPSATKKLKIAVVGGGIGGLCVAIGLLKHPHIDVQIYEAARQFSEIGAGVAFSPNSQLAMHMIDPRILQGFERQASHNYWPSQRKVWFQFRIGAAGERADELLAAPQNRTGQGVIHRASFLDQLIKLVPPQIAHFGKRLVNIVDNASDGVQLRFEDGEEVLVDAVISADGIHSPTRKFLLGENHPSAKPVFTGHAAYRALVPMEEARQVLKSEYTDNSVIWTSLKGMVMCYPIDFGKTLNIVLIKSHLSSWDEPQWIVPASGEEVLKSFTGLADAAQRVVDLVAKQEGTKRWALWDYPNTPYFYKRNVCMMGDAAHATTPFQGAGAGMAIEDALVLARLFENVTEKGHIEAAFKAYDSVHRERACKVATTSRKLGNYYSLVDGKDEAMVSRLKDHVNNMGWLWHPDLDAHVQDAVNTLKELIEC